MPVISNYASNVNSSRQCPRTYVKKHHVRLAQDGVCLHIHAFPRTSLLAFAFRLSDIFPSQGFGLSFGSDLYLAISKYGRDNEAAAQAAESEFLTGTFHAANTSSVINAISGAFTFLDSTGANPYLVKGLTLPLFDEIFADHLLFRNF